MADKETEQQNRTLKELVVNQKETNQTLVSGFEALKKSGAEDSTFMSKNLGSLMEVAATIGAVETQIAHEKREEMTEVDERVQDLTKQTKKESEKSRNLLQVIADASTNGPGGPAPDPPDPPDSTRRERLRESMRRTGEAFAPLTSAMKKMSDTFKGGILGFKSKLTLGGLALGAFALAVLAFIDTPWFDKIYNVLVNVVPKALAWIYNNVLKPLGDFLWEYLGPLFTDIREAIDGTGKKSWWNILWDNKAAIFGIALALGVVGKVIALVGLGVKIFAGIWTALSIAIPILLSPFGLILLAIGAVLVAGYLIFKNWDAIAKKLEELSLLDVLKGVGWVFKKAVAMVIGAILDFGYWMAGGIYSAIGTFLPNEFGGDFFKQKAKEVRAQKGSEQVESLIDKGMEGLISTLGFEPALERLDQISVMDAAKWTGRMLNPIPVIERDIAALMKTVGPVTDAIGKYKNLTMKQIDKNILDPASEFLGLNKPKDPAILKHFFDLEQKLLTGRLAKGEHPLDARRAKGQSFAEISATQNLLGQETSKALLANIKTSEGSLAAIQQQTTVLGEVKDAIGTFTEALLSGNFGQMFQSNKTTNISSTNTPMVSQSYYLGPAWYNKVGNSQ